VVYLDRLFKRAQALWSAQANRVAHVMADRPHRAALCNGVIGPRNAVENAFSMIDVPLKQ
jgi:hypothetical protein